MTARVTVFLPVTATTAAELHDAVDAVWERTQQSAPDEPAPAPDPDSPVLLRLREAATLLGVSLSTVEELVTRGDLPVVRIQKCVRVRRDELQTWLDVLTEQQRRRNGGGA